MADVFTKQKRSMIMSRIRSKNTSIDIAMRDMLSDAGVRFEMYPDLYGRPDFQVGKRTLVFCDGDFGTDTGTRKRSARQKSTGGKRYRETCAATERFPESCAGRDGPS